MCVSTFSVTALDVVGCGTALTDFTCPTPIPAKTSTTTTTIGQGQITITTTTPTVRLITMTQPQKTTTKTNTASSSTTEFFETIVDSGKTEIIVPSWSPSSSSTLITWTIENPFVIWIIAGAGLVVILAFGICIFGSLWLRARNNNNNASSSSMNNVASVDSSSINQFDSTRYSEVFRTTERIFCFFLTERFFSGRTSISKCTANLNEIIVWGENLCITKTV